MLILARKLHESIIISDNILIKILGFHEGNTGTIVNIGIDAPHDISVDREEIWYKKKDNKEKEIKEGNK